MSYHDRASLKEAESWASSLPFVTLVNLDDLSLPNYLTGLGVDSEALKTVLSEVLALLTVEPRTKYVGFLTYSAVRKFSASWAARNGSAYTHLPRFEPEDLKFLDWESSDGFFLERQVFPRWKRNIRVSRELTNLIDSVESLPEPAINMKSSWIVPASVHRDYARQMKKTLPSAIKLGFAMPLQEQSETDRWLAENLGETAAKITNSGPRMLRKNIGGAVERLSGKVMESVFANKTWTPIRGRAIQGMREQHAKKQPLMVTFADSSQDKVLTNWLIATEKHWSGQYEVVALDSDTHLRLTSAGFNSTLRQPMNLKLESIWRLRLLVVLEKLRSGRDVLLSDLDAVLVGRAESFLRFRGDIVSSQGTFHPRRIAHMRRRVLCMGWILFRASRVTIEILEHAIRRGDTREIPFDDQREINMAIWEFASEPIIQPDYVLAFDSERVMYCNNSPLEIRGEAPSRSPFTCVIAPHAMVPRIPDFRGVEDAVVVHPLSPKVPSEKPRALDEFDGWYLESSL